MDAALIFGPTSATHDMSDMNDFYEQNEYVRRSFGQVAEWSGFDVDILLHRRARPVDAPLMRINSIGLAAGMLGIHAALTAAGVRPTVIGGISLGELVAGWAAGSLSERQLVDVLVTNDERPASTDPERKEAIAFVFVSSDQDVRHYYEQQRDGVHVAVDFGLVRAGKGRLLMLSGYRYALERFAARDRNYVDVPAEHLSCAAHHTPLREHARAHLARHLAQVSFADPIRPVCSCLDGLPVQTAEDVRAAFLRNQVEPLRIEKMINEMAAHRPDRAIAIGPFLRRGAFHFPFPVTYVDTPASIEQVADMVLAAVPAR